ncbi:hypothetical protein [Bacillus sinesaloumensis]|uniref:hypothetical protein n=1 Tax=Litchfieldia sinesaloumensis TaxID=1926280 RepID=UPI0009883EE2|nr:hypothetical protein [Bacillus sinesaloumensis]
MKRYWKILTLSFITVIVLGTFYIQSSLASQNIQIEFETVSGDEGEVDNLEMNVSYVVDDMYQDLRVSQEGTVNLTDRSLFEQLTSVHTWDSIDQLIKEYKGFMRGKHLNPNSFFEDKNMVIYVNVEGNSINSSNFDSSFEIDILDKKSEESVSMTLDLPNKEKYHWVDINDIQILNNELKVIARGSGINSGEDLLVYTIDLKDKKIENEEVVYSSPQVKNGWSGFRVFSDFYSTEPEQYFVFLSEAYEHDESGMGTELAKDRMIYDIQNNKLLKLEVPEDFTVDFDKLSIVNSTLIVPNYSPDGIKLMQYEIETGQWEEKQTIDIVNMESDENAPFINILNEKIYIVEATKEGHHLSIGDINSGETLYEGKIIVKNNDTKDYKIYFNNIKEQ